MEVFKLEQFKFHGITTPVKLDDIYKEGMSFEELDEKVIDFIFDQEIDGHDQAFSFLYTFDKTMEYSLNLAHKMKLDLRGLDSQMLATILYHETLLEDWELIKDDLDQLLKNKK